MNLGNSLEILQNMDNLNTEELLISFPYLRNLNADMSNLDDVGQHMLRKYVHGKSSNSLFYSDHAWAKTDSQIIPMSAMSNAPKSNKVSIWQQLKQEFYKLVCTKDRAYTKVRQKLFSSTKLLINSIVFSIAAAIGKVIGIAAGAVSGAVAAFIFALAKMGLNVYCKAAAQNP